VDLWYCCALDYVGIYGMCHKCVTHQFGDSLLMSSSWYMYVCSIKAWSQSWSTWRHSLTRHGSKTSFSSIGKFCKPGRYSHLCHRSVWFETAFYWSCWINVLINTLSLNSSSFYSQDSHIDCCNYTLVTVQMKRCLVLPSDVGNDKDRVPTNPWKSLNFFLYSRPWKYLKTVLVLENPWIWVSRSLKVLEFS